MNASPAAAAAAAITTTETTPVTLPLKRKKASHHTSDGQYPMGATPAAAAAAAFMTWRVADAKNVVRHHWLPVILGGALLFFMWVEYTLSMVPTSSPPFDLGFVATRRLHRLLSSSPELNNLLAALNTVFVGMQASYIFWTFLVEGRARPTIAALFMFTCRGILGYTTQLPLPEGYLGSGVDFPVGNVSFFLFYSGHVAGSVIASQDMRRMQRYGLAWAYDILNVLQVVRLLGSRGHYTIDLAAGYAAGLLFDSLAGRYEETMIIAAGKKTSKQHNGVPPPVVVGNGNSSSSARKLRKK
ncbi:unnamed protein product [Linum tenue]|uniref:AtPDCT1/2 transmembrane domain-containing protein n=1 Tax=Linum tenue TaxID=586396 RepID=A0AAV0KK16_9ROSI|nr:unnamed protein product [Linum tenue]